MDISVGTIGNHDRAVSRSRQDTEDAGDFAALLSSPRPSPDQGNSSDRFTASQVASAFDTWFDEWSAMNSGYAFVDETANARNAFVEIAQKAEDAEGFEHPQQFISSLSRVELDVLRQVHGLADPIDPATLSREGALNLLLAAGQSQDLDGDNLVSVGAGRKFVFPPANAPQTVKAAWEATKDILGGASMLDLSASMMSGMVGFSVASAARTVASTATGDDYAAMVSNLIEGLQQSANSNAVPVQRESLDHRIYGLQIFLDHLRDFEA